MISVGHPSGISRLLFPRATRLWQFYWTSWTELATEIVPDSDPALL
jgi:hypothetical protein